MARNRILGYRAQTRSRMIAYTLTFACLIVIVASMQVALLGRIKPLGAVPDLMICTVLCVAYFSGKYSGAMVGIAAGFLIEAIGSQGISLLPIVYMIGGYVAGHYAKSVMRNRYVTYLFYLACALFVRAGMTVIYACLHYEFVNLPKILLYSVLPEGIGTAIAGCVLYFPVGLVCMIPERKKQRF